jgi:hypothetical protein
LVTVLRLTSGAEIVGSIVKEDYESITVNNPLQILYVHRVNGPPTITLQRYIPFTSEENLKVQRHCVETTCKPVQGLPEYYDSALKTIQEHIDPSLVADLIEAVEPKKSTNYDSYLAMLERHMAKKPLN